MDKTNTALDLSPIAIVGMSLRVPGADTLEQYWSNLSDGVESVTFFTDDELRARGVDEQTLRHPDYVKAMGRLDGIDQFDARFFEMTPREADILDPQHRVLMETVWRALEHAAIDPERFPGRIGLFAGVGLNAYLLHNLLPNRDLLESAGGWQLNLGNDKDFATTRIAYKFNFQGPAISVNTACSTSLVATALAAQSLQSHQCDVVLAGGCSIHLPQDEGYTYIKGGTVSPDGHCRPFDVQSAGTFDGNGAAVVVLKRLEDALADRDTIHAVIHGYAVNNDGSLKVGYTAPSVEGQSDVIREAMEMAGLAPDRIGFIETHGTATELGDSIEIAALADAFCDLEDAGRRCLLGAVKSNIGHLDTAAGAAGLIKAALAVRQGAIPPTCHFTSPNPILRMEDTPFRVASSLEVWDEEERYAGVSSFGIGGTNAHVILGRAPGVDAATSAADEHVLCLPLSAQSPAALSGIAKALADHLVRYQELDLSDVAFTLQEGRRHFQHRICAIMPAAARSACIEWLEQCANDIDKHMRKHALMMHEDCMGAHGVKELAANVRTWLAGDQIEWDRLVSAADSSSDAPARLPRRVPIPGHPFDRRRHWIDPVKSPQPAATPAPASTHATAPAPAHIAKDPDVRNWFYLPGGRRVASSIATPAEGARWLFIRRATDSSATRPALEQMLDASLSQLEAHKLDIRTLEIPDPRLHGPSDWTALLDSLGTWVPVHIIDASLVPDSNNHQLGIVTETATGTSSGTATETTTGTSSGTATTAPSSAIPSEVRHMTALGRALGQRYFSEEIAITLLAPGTSPLGHAAMLNPSLAAALGPLKVIPQEYPNLSTRALDVEGPADPAMLASELCDIDGPRAILIKDGRRWMESFERLPIHDPKSTSSSRLKRGGVCLITGGLGQIGLALSGHLAATLGASIVLTGRSPLEEESSWDALIADPATSPSIVRRLKALKEIQSLGSDVLYVQADVSDREEMEAAFAEAEARFGRIDIVIHAAGIVGEASFITINDSAGSKGVAATEAQFKSKVRGTQVLASLLEHRSFDLCMICSSLSPILGGLGFSAYAATNLQADALAASLNARQPGKWMSVNWEGWMFDHEALPGSLGASSAFELGMTSSEGVEAFTMVMDQPSLDRVVISSGPLDRRLAQWIQRSASASATASLGDHVAHPHEGARGAAGSGSLADAALGSQAAPQGTMIKRVGHARPDILGEAVPPSTETQTSLAAIWEDLLGIDGIGIQDSFFELGGNSLLMTQMVAMMRRTFRVELSLSELFEHPSIERIAEQIEALQGTSSPSDDREEGVL